MVVSIRTETFPLNLNILQLKIQLMSSVYALDTASNFKINAKNILIITSRLMLSINLCKLFILWIINVEIMRRLPLF